MNEAFLLWTAAELNSQWRQAGGWPNKQSIYPDVHIIYEA